MALGRRNAMIYSFIACIISCWVFYTVFWANCMRMYICLFEDSTINDFEYYVPFSMNLVCQSETITKVITFNAKCTQRMSSLQLHTMVIKIDKHDITYQRSGKFRSFPSVCYQHETHESNYFCVDTISSIELKFFLETFDASLYSFRVHNGIL